MKIGMPAVTSSAMCYVSIGCVCVCVCVYTHTSTSECVSRSVMWDSVTPWTVACQAPLSMEFSRQEYWHGLPFPTPGNVPHPGIEPTSLALLHWQILYH